MKKFFLIPVLALFTCVSAWGVDFKELPDPAGVLKTSQAKASVRKALMDEEPVAANEAKIGSTEYATLQEAIDAAADGAVIELLSDVAANAELDAAVIEDKDITIKGNGFVLNGAINLFGATKAIHVTFDGVQVNSPAWAWIVYGDAELILAAGSTNSLASAAGYGCYGFGNCNLVISGTGSLTASMLYSFYHAKSVQVDAPNVTFSGTDLYHWSASWGNKKFVLNGGSYSFDPSSFVNFNSRVVTKPSELYVVSAPAVDVVAYNPSLLATYTSLSAAIEAASSSDEVYVYKADATAISVDKNLTIHANGFSTNLTAASGYARADMGQDIAFTDNAIAAFLMADGTNSMTIDADIDIANAGAIYVHGDKTLTIADGVTVTYKRQGSNGNIVVTDGAKLTVLGKGTFKPIVAQRAWDAADGNRVIDNYGTLVVGVKDDVDNNPKFYTYSLQRGSAISTYAGGTTTINNAEIYAANVATWNTGGTQIINGGRFLSVSHLGNGFNSSWRSYMLQNQEGAHTVINGGFFQGVHGCFSADTEANVDINGGTFHTVYGINLSEYTGDNAWEEVGTINKNHYAFYVAQGAMVNVYGGDFWCQLPNAGAGKIAMLDDNDAYDYFGVANIYGGRWQKKVVVGSKSGRSYFPSFVPLTSQWYSSFSGEAPLPAGYEYYETGNETYPWGVRADETKDVDAIDPDAREAQEANPEYTIPWQQTTTWASDEVPVENTIVTIPVDATVTVSKDETTKTAVADQVYVAQGATLKVEDGTTLTVGEGGMNIGFGGKLIVEPGAIVKVGDAGVVTTDNEALVIEATETDQAVLLYDPTVPVSENTQPKATVKLTTKSKMLNNSPYQYTYQRFALPVKIEPGKSPSVPENDFDPSIHEYFDATEESYGFESYIYYWNSRNWANCNWSALVPFKGYQLANNSKNGGVVYTFKGNLLGNEDGEYNFAEYGFDFFGNSYTAPINVETFLNGFGSDVEATIWLYNYTTTNWQQVSLEDFEDGFVDDEYKQIKSMDGFLLNLRAASGSANVNYNDAIWSNPLLGTSPSLAPARRVANSNLSNSAVITVTEANGHGDAVTLVEKATRSNEFENGADASKYMTEDGLSLYAETNAGLLSRVATNDLNNTLITFRSGDETNYNLTIDKTQGEDYILRDNVTGNTIALANGATYNFTQAAHTTVPARFEVIGIAKAPTAIDNIEETAKISGIYTITGQFLGHDFTNLPAGVYVVNGVKIVK